MGACCDSSCQGEVRLRGGVWLPPKSEREGEKKWLPRFTSHTDWHGGSRKGTVNKHKDDRREGCVGFEVSERQNSQQPVAKQSVKSAGLESQLEER